MESLRVEALRVFLQHELASALVVHAVVEQRMEHHGEQTLKASEAWVTRVRNAQAVCGVFGLLAIDRSETRLYHCLRSDYSFGWQDMENHSHRAMKFQKAADCYVNALLRQLRRDSSNAALWSYAGMVYDHIDATKLNSWLQDQETYHTASALSCRSSQNQSLATKYESKSYNQGSDAETAVLVAEIAHQYNAAVAHTAVYNAVTSSRRGGYSQSHGLCAAASAECLVDALEYTENALQCDAPDEKEVQTLWRLCARYMRSAAEEAHRLTDGGVNYWQKIGASVAYLTSKLKGIVGTLRGLSFTALDLREVKQRLSEAFEMVNECPLVSDPTGTTASSFDAEPIGYFIDELAFAVEKMVSRVPPEQKIIDRFQAAADKMNFDRSPAHRCVKECLLEAAKKMRQAIAAANEEESRLHNLRSSFLEKLALGPFTVAAGYYSKADRAVTPKAQELWREAGRALVYAAASLRGRSCFFDLSESVHFNRQEEEMETMARQCAEAAVCSERVCAGQTSTIQCAQKRALQEAELQLRLALIETGGEVSTRENCLSSYDCTRISKKLLTWCEQQQTPTLTLPAPGAPPVGAEQQLEAQHATALRVERRFWCACTLWLRSPLLWSGQLRETDTASRML
jgi:hypothetical protein